MYKPIIRYKVHGYTTEGHMTNIIDAYNESQAMEFYTKWSVYPVLEITWVETIGDLAMIED